MKIRMTGEQRRAAIVRSAIHLFAEKGFRGTTTRELAAALGITEPVLYQHFRNKRELYAAILEDRVREAAGETGELASAAEVGDDRAFFTRLGRLILDRYQRDPDISRLLLFSCLERHEFGGMFFDRLFRRLNRLVAGYIRRRIREGAFRKCNAGVAARGIIGMISYQGLLGLLFPEQAAKAGGRALDELVDLFLEGIAAGRA
jgi:AcrR family transcriptional regulator